MKIRVLMAIAACSAVLTASLGGCASESRELPSADENITAEENVIADEQPVSFTDEVLPEEVGYEFGAHRYEIYASEGASWDEMQEICGEQGGYLAVIASEEENAFLYDLAGKKGFQAVLFGLYREENSSEWKWISGEPVDYTNWHEGEPNNSTGVEYYGMFYPDFEQGQWNDGDQNDIEAFICEWD